MNEYPPGTLAHAWREVELAVRELVRAIRAVAEDTAKRRKEKGSSVQR